MLFLNLAWNGRFMKVSKCNASKIIFNKIIQLFPDRTCRTLTSTCAFRCMILRTCYCRKTSFCRMKNGSESVFFRRFCQAVAAALSAKSKDKSLCDKEILKYFPNIFQKSPDVLRSLSAVCKSPDPAETDQS